MSSQIKQEDHSTKVMRFAQIVAVLISTIMLALAIFTSPNPKRTATWKHQAPAANGNGVSAVAPLEMAEFTDRQHSDSSAEFTALARKRAIEMAVQLNDPNLDVFRGDGRVVVKVDNVIPSEKRWKITFDEKLTQKTYAKQLDGLGIELAIIGDEERLFYLSKVSAEEPEKRPGPAADESRMYLTWSGGNLLEADKAFFEKAKLPMLNSIVLHFISAETETTLAKLEKEFKNVPVSQIIQTEFGVKTGAEGYEFYVLNQKTR